jgi:hypothetical protein
MRVGLMTTVARDEALRRRVTILPGTVAQVADRLPAGLKPAAQDLDSSLFSFRQPH